MKKVNNFRKPRTPLVPLEVFVSWFVENHNEFRPWLRQNAKKGWFIRDEGRVLATSELRYSRAKVNMYFKCANEAFAFRMRWL